MARKHEFLPPTAPLLCDYITYPHYRTSKTRGLVISWVVMVVPGSATSCEMPEFRPQGPRHIAVAYTTCATDWHDRLGLAVTQRRPHACVARTLLNVTYISRKARADLCTIISSLQQHNYRTVISNWKFKKSALLWFQSAFPLPCWRLRKCGH